MKNLTLIAALLISTASLAKCPSVLLKKKVSQRTAYTSDFKKISGKEHDTMKSLGCNPTIKPMSTAQLKSLLKAEYDRKLSEIGG